VETRPVTADDRGAIEALTAAAFAEAPDGRVVRLVRARAAGGAARTGVAAVVDGELAGYAGLSRAWVDARRALVEVLVLSPLAVRPDHQGRGVGTTLVGAALTEADRRGAPAVFLEGDPAYYGARGFRSGTSSGFRRPSDRIPEPAFQVALLSAHEPWMVGRLVYPDAFWSTDTVGLRDPRLREVEEALGAGRSDR
jgi:putative acetyltransferase